MTVGAALQVVNPQSSIANLQSAAARTHRKRRDVCATRVPHVALRFSGARSAVRQATDCGFYFPKTRAAEVQNNAALPCSTVAIR